MVLQSIDKATDISNIHQVNHTPPTAKHLPSQSYYDYYDSHRHSEAFLEAGNMDSFDQD